MSIFCYEGFVRRLEGQKGVDVPIFDQLSYGEDFLKEQFKSIEWDDIVAKMKAKGIRRLMPATENGFRNIAVRLLAKQAHLINLNFSGNERELDRHVYLAKTIHPDPIDYQVLVAASKHGRIRRASDRKLKRTRVITPDKLEDHTALVAFDTVIWAWNGEKYISKEKPKSREEAIETIELLVSGQQVLVSTVANVQKI